MTQTFEDNQKDLNTLFRITDIYGYIHKIYYQELSQIKFLKHNVQIIWYNNIGEKLVDGVTSSCQIAGQDALKFLTTIEMTLKYEFNEDEFE